MVSLLHLDKRPVMVGGPFSANTAILRERNIVATEMLGHAVAIAGGAPTVPNSMGRTYDGKPAYETWIEIALTTLSGSKAFIVTPEWERSTGTKREIESAFFFGIPVFYAKYRRGFRLPSTFNKTVLKEWFATPDYGYDIGALKEWLATPEHRLKVLSPDTKSTLLEVQNALVLPEPKNSDERAEQIWALHGVIGVAQEIDDPAFDKASKTKLAGYTRQLGKRIKRLKAA